MSAWIFWIALLLVAWTYAGYAALVTVLARRRGRAPQQRQMLPPVTVVVAAHDEAGRIGARVHDLLAQDYPPERLAVLVVSDGSGDGTERAVPQSSRVRVLALARNEGKAAALNAALTQVDTEFVAFTDARQRFAPDALRRLLAAFADPAVGAVSGELQIVDAAGVPQPAGPYWRLEKSLREREASIGWLHGVSGAIYALRTRLFRPLPPGTILDDMWIPLHAAFAGACIWMARDAVACDAASASIGEEYRRKLRTLAGNWQLIARMPRLLHPVRNPLFFAWFSHKFLRLIAPWALLAAWLASAFAGGALYRLAFFVQSAAYAIAAFALLAPRLAARIPLAAAAGSFAMLNAAALLALPACLALDPRGLWKKH